MKTALILAALATLALPACSTAPDGSETFLGLSGPGWAGVGQDAAKAATQAAMVSYGTRRALTATKNPVNVLP